MKKIIFLTLMLISMYSYSQEVITVNEQNNSIIINNVTYFFTQQDFLDLTVNAKTACFETIDKKYIFRKTVYKEDENKLLFLWDIIPEKQIKEKCQCIYEKVKYKNVSYTY